MRRGATSLVLGALLGCDAQPAATPPTLNARQAQPLTQDAATTCVQATGFQEPVLTLADLGQILGGVAFYSTASRFPLLFTGPWTNWYSEPLNTGLAKLSVMRGVLEKFNLSDTYLPTGHPPPVSCTGKLTARQADGTCNDPIDSRMGAAGVRFARNIPVLLPRDPADLTKGVVPNPLVYPSEATLLSPDPRTVSRKLFTRGKRGFQPHPSLNLLAGAWTQFQVHDWFNHQNSPTASLRVPLAPDDPLRRLRIDELVIPRSLPDVRGGAELLLLPPVYTNEVTHWWDASQIYGSSDTTAASLRARGRGGALRATLQIGEDGLLPVGPGGVDQTGFNKNWWVGLAVLHNLFAREHNAIVAMLRAAHPELDEQGLYDRARLINAAQIAKIHTVEWTPAILPNPTVTAGLYSNWYGLKRFVPPGTDLSPILAFVQTLPADQQASITTAIQGVIGSPRNLLGHAYALTEEFTSVYRMHALLPDRLVIRSADGRSQRRRIYRTERTAFGGARAVQEREELADLVYSFGIGRGGALTLANYPAFLQELRLPTGAVLDMGAVDVLRDRERGIPRYNDFREQLRLKRVPSIEELTPDAELRAALREVYGDDAAAIDRVDALVGFLAEAQRPTCYGFGETIFQVFTLMATRRLQADRFYTNDYRPEIYTQEGLDWIAQSSMKRVLLRHFPQLARTGLGAIENAFMPWPAPALGDSSGDGDDSDSD